MWFTIAGVGQSPQVVPKLDFSTPEFSTHRCLPEKTGSKAVYLAKLVGKTYEL